MVQKRDLGMMIILFIVTFGLYFFYWAVKTKNELNAMGGEIPTALLMIIPFANFYFWYRYAQAFCKYVTRSNDELAYFALLAFVPFVGMFIVQDKLNKLA